MLGKNRYLIAMLFVLFVAFGLRVWDLQNIPPGIYYDTGRIMQRIWRFNAGYGVLLYFQDIAEPFDFLIRAIYHRLTGGVILYMSQMYTVCLGVLSVAATGLCARVLYREHPYRDLISLMAAFTLATMPTLIILNQHIFRANWLPLTIALTVTALVIAWRNGKFTPAFFSGVFMGISTSFYTGGLLFPPAMALVVLVQLLITGFTWRRIQQLFVMSIGFGVAMLPWLYYFVRVPNWHMRVGDLSEGRSPLSDPSLFSEHLQITLSTIFVPTTLHDLRYNTFTTAFLNPVFVALFAIGFAIVLWRWRKSWMLTPLLISAVMIFPNVLSSEPYQPVRMVGTFLGLALLVGLGTAELYRLPIKRVMQFVIAGLLIGIPIYSGYHIWYHFNQQPMITNPHVPLSIALKYRLGFQDLFRDIVASDTATYLPMEYINSDMAVNVLRVDNNMSVQGYDGRALPDGRVILPRNDISYGFFFVDHIPVQYGLLLPESSEVIILPPLSVEDAQALHDGIRNNGEDFTNDEDWILGQQQMFTGDHPFRTVRNTVGDVIATYDGNLELVGIDTPSELTPNTMQPITLYWRLREQQGKDYYSRLQVWDAADNSYSFERTSPIVGEPNFPLNIHFNIYPTVMWEAGEIVADTRWLPIPENLPDSAYRFALAIYSYPGFVPVQTTAPLRDIWGMVGRTAYNLDAYATPADAPDTDLMLGENYHLREYQLSTHASDLKAGDTLTASVIWYVEQTTSEDYISFLHVLDATGALVTQQDTQPFGGQFPTWAFPAGHDVTLNYSVTIPEDAQAPFIVRTGMYTYPEIQPLPAFDNGEVLPDNAFVLE